VCGCRDSRCSSHAPGVTTRCARSALSPARRSNRPCCASRQGRACARLASRQPLEARRTKPIGQSLGRAAGFYNDAGDEKRLGWRFCCTAEQRRWWQELQPKGDGVESSRAAELTF
jgi:hypothetical protein